MATTDYSADYLGRPIIDLIDGENDAGYLGRHVIEGDRDYLGRALRGAPTPVTTQAPTWVDDEENGGGSWSTESQEGVTYSPSSGTANPGQSVTVTATADDGYVIDGEDSWSHTFPDEPPPTPVATQEPDWVDDAENGGGTWTTASQAGVTYSPASGTADPGELITVTATAGDGYVIDGDASWSHTFPEAPAG